MKPYATRFTPPPYFLSFLLTAIFLSNLTPLWADDPSAICDDFGDRSLVLERWSENLGVVHPCVLREVGDFKMWFHSLLPSLNGAIFLATSPDGLAWTNQGPVLQPGQDWDDIHIYNASVLKNGTSYQMWYTGYDGPHGIGYATSPDGVNWTKHPGNPVVSTGTWDSLVLFVGSVLYDQGTSTYRLWYTGGNAFFRPLEVGYATSPDGINWIKHGSPVFSSGQTVEWINNHVNVILQNDTYEMYFSSSTGDIRVATSVDGINWTESACGPFLEPSDVGWDSIHVGHASILLDNGVKRMWYDGNENSQPLPAIGHAERSSKKAPATSEWGLIFLTSLILLCGGLTIALRRGAA